MKRVETKGSLKKLKNLKLKFEKKKLNNESSREFVRQSSVIFSEDLAQSVDVGE